MSSPRRTRVPVSWTALLVVTLGSWAGAQVASDVRGAIGKIDLESIQADLEYLASDALYGRHTSQRGQEQAAEYIAQQFEKAGLQVVPGHDGWNHLWEMGVIDVDESASRLLIHRPQGEPEPFAVRKDFIPVRISVDGDVRAPIVFVGYGIQAPKFRHDDYAKIDVRGKIALALWQEPRQDKGGRSFDGKQLTRHASFFTKAKLAQERGAVALMVVSGPILFGDDPEAAGFELPSHNWPQISKKRERIEIPVVHVSRGLAEALLGRDLEEVQKECDRRSESHEIPDVEIDLGVKIRPTSRQVANVVGYRPGSDPELKEQHIVLGAHYDHMGVDFDGTGLIHNGADDNASGTTALLAVARVLANSDVELKRGLLFIAFSGEEEGLLGSKGYCEKPLLPLSSAVAMLNMDMVGRNRLNEITIGEPDENRLLRRSIHRANVTPGVRLKIEYGGNEFFNRSDQFHFHQAGVPAAFFFAGLHDDYHKPTDTVEKILEKKVQRVARLIAGTAAELANADATPGGSR